MMNSQRTRRTVAEHRPSLRSGLLWHAYLQVQPVRTVCLISSFFQQKKKNMWFRSTPQCSGFRQADDTKNKASFTLSFYFGQIWFICLALQTIWTLMMSLIWKSCTKLWPLRSSSLKRVIDTYGICKGSCTACQTLLGLLTLRYRHNRCWRQWAMTHIWHEGEIDEATVHIPTTL